MNATDAAHSEGHEGWGLYVFCFTRASAVEAATGPGLAGDAPLGARVYGEVAAICCEVPLDEWTGDRGEAQLKDLAWLGPRALRHEEVIERMMRTSPVLPLRFGCLFSSARRLEELLQRERGRIAAFIDKAEHEEEWSLQGTLDVQACEEAMFLADPRVAKLPASAGARYLMEQKLRKDAARAARVWAREIQETLGRALEGLVLERRTLRPTQEGDFHWALLAPRGSEAELSRRLEPLAEQLSERGLGLSASGPWPTYNFAPRLGEEPGDEAEERTHG